MFDVEKLLTGIGCQAKEGGYRKPPPLPYAVYLTSEERRGADLHNNIREMEVTVELYSEGREKEIENRIEERLNLITVTYEKERIWLESEKMLETVYSFTKIEKMEG